jgi:Tol biopolymer transport system component
MVDVPRPEGSIRIPNNEIWIVRPDGTDERKIATGLEASWSHDGRYVHVVSIDDHSGASCVRKLSNVPVDGGPAVPISTPSLVNGDTSFAWSPDDTQIAYQHQDGGVPCESQGGYFWGPLGLRVMNADGTNMRILRAPTPSFALKSWAADGTALITTGDVRPEDGTDHPGPIQRINIADGTVTSTAIPSHVFGDITVSPDGSRIAYLIYGVTSEYSQVAVAELGGATEQLVGDHTYSAWAYAGYLAWSREGALALVRVTKTGSHYDERLFVARPPATTITQVFDLGGLSPSWSADGTRLACLVSFEAPSGTPKIAVVNAVDGGVTYVPGVSSASFVSWQP